MVYFQKQFGLDFDDPGWQQYLSSLKPLVSKYMKPNEYIKPSLEKSVLGVFDKAKGFKTQRIVKS